MSSTPVVPDQAPDASAAMASQPIPQGVSDVAQSAQQSAAQPQQAKPSLWRSVVQGALMGLANSAGQTSFGGGLAAGAAGPIKQSLINQEQSRANQQQLNNNMEAADAHQRSQVQTAMAQANLAQLQHNLAMEPPDRQTAFLEDRIKQAMQLRASGAQVPVGDEGDYHDVVNRITKLHQTDPTKLFTPEPVRGADGGITWQVYESTDAPIAEDATVDIGGGQQVKFPKGSITGKQLTAYQLQAANQMLSNQSAASQAKLKTAEAAQTKAGAAVTAANAKAAGAVNKPDNLSSGMMPDGSSAAGTPEELKAAGATSIVKLPAAEVSRVTAARDMLSPITADGGGGLYNLVAQDLTKIAAKGGLDPLTTRWQEFMTGKVGHQEDPDYTQLRLHLGLLQTKMQQYHVGNRGSDKLLQKFEDLFTAKKMDTPTLVSSVYGLHPYLVEGAKYLPKKGK